MAFVAPGRLLAALLLAVGPGAAVMHKGAEALLARPGRPLNFRVILINLDRRQDRLHKVLERLPLAGEPLLLERACRMPAVDGTNATIRQELVRQGLLNLEELGFYNSRLDNSEADRLTPGAMGCYASHWQALRHIGADRSLDFGLIIEDDLQYFSPDFPEQFAKLWRNDDGHAEDFWREAELVYLQYDGGGWQKGGKRAPNATQLKDIRGLWPKNTGMYAVSPAFARRLSGDPEIPNDLGKLAPMVAQVDSVLPGGAEVWAFEPPIAQTLDKAERGGDTDIQAAFLQLASQSGRLDTC